MVQYFEDQLWFAYCHKERWGEGGGGGDDRVGTGSEGRRDKERKGGLGQRVKGGKGKRILSEDVLAVDASIQPTLHGRHPRSPAISPGNDHSGIGAEERTAGVDLPGSQGALTALCPWRNVNSL